MNYHWDWGIYLAALPGRRRHLPRHAAPGPGHHPGHRRGRLGAWPSWPWAPLVGIAPHRSPAASGPIPLHLPGSSCSATSPSWCSSSSWYFVVPELLPRRLPAPGSSRLPNAAFYTAVLGIGLYMSARVAVQLAAGIGSPVRRASAPPAPPSASPRLQTYRYVLLPVAYRVVLPAHDQRACSATLKNTSVALTIGLAELTAPRPLHAGVLVPGVRGLRRRHGRLCCRHRPRRHRCLARQCWNAGSAIPGYGAGMSNFDFDVIQRSLPYSIPSRHALHPHPHLPGRPPAASLLGTVIALLRLSAASAPFRLLRRRLR